MSIWICLKQVSDSLMSFKSWFIFENTNVGRCRIGMQMFYQTKPQTLWVYSAHAKENTRTIPDSENMNSRTW